MRLLFIRQNYPPERGPFRYIYNLAGDLALRGHEVTVVTGIPHYPYGVPYDGYKRYNYKIQYENGVKVIRLPLLMASNTQPLKRIAGFFSFAISSLCALMLVEKPQIIICSVPPLTVSLTVSIISIMRKIPQVLMLHDFEPLRSLELRGKIDNPFARWMVAKFASLYGNADKIIVPIYDEYQALMEYGIDKNKVDIIPHGVDPIKFDELSRFDIPFKLTGNPGRRKALYLGTIGMAHDVETTIKAFADSRIREMPIDLFVVGDGECLPECRAIVNDYNLDNVFLLPPVDFTWVPNVLSQADILIMSQKPQPFSLGSKFCEYLAAGIPLMVNSTGILARTIKKIGNGWIFDAYKPDSLVKALDEYLSLSQCSLDMLKFNSRHAAEEIYNSRAYHDKWEKILQLLSDKHSQIA